MATLAGLSETGNAYSITITDTSVDAAALNTLDGKTTVAIDASNITTLTGAAADLNTAYTANDNGSITGLGNEAATLSDTSLAVSVLNDLNSNTSGTINAGNITTLTGAAADLNTAYTANDNGSISGLNNENVTLSDTTLDVSTLNTLDGNTSGTIDASSITALSGAADDLNTAYAANDNGSISGLSNEDVTLSDTTLDVSVLNTLMATPQGPSMPAASPPSPGPLKISTPPTPPTTTAPSQALRTRTSPSLTPLSTLPFSTPSMTTPQVPSMPAASPPSPVLLHELITAYASNGISGLGNEAVNVDSGTATTDQVNTLAAATSAVVTATLSDGDMANTRWPQRNRQRLLHHHHGHLR